MTFQALRIHINSEFVELKRGMASALTVMRQGGKLGIITWKHSECAIVVDQFRWLEVSRQDFPLLVWYKAAQKALKAGDDSQLPHNRQPDAEYKTARQDMKKKNLKKGHGFLMEDVSRPTPDEISVNSRSRSALLHVFEKQTGVLASTLEEAAYPLFGWGLDDSEPPVVAPPATLQDGLVALADPGGSKKSKKPKPEKKQKKAKGPKDGNATPSASTDSGATSTTTTKKKKKKLSAKAKAKLRGSWGAADPTGTITATATATTTTATTTTATTATTTTTTANPAVTSSGSSGSSGAAKRRRKKDIAASTAQATPAVEAAGLVNKNKKKKKSMKTKREDKEDGNKANRKDKADANKDNSKGKQDDK